MSVQNGNALTPAIIGSSGSAAADRPNDCISLECISSWYFRILAVVFAAGQRYTALQQQMIVSPYTPGNINKILTESPSYHEILSFLVYVQRLRSDMRSRMDYD